MKLVLNRPLATTYGWLRANGTAVETEVTAPVTLWEELPDGVSVRQTSDPDDSVLRSGVGTDTEKLLARSEMHEYRVEADRQTSGVLRLHFSFSSPGRRKARPSVCWILRSRLPRESSWSFWAVSSC